MKKHALYILTVILIGVLSGCTVKAVGDPDRPITIKADITLNIKGLEQTATGIEDFVSGKTTKEDLPVK
ncbi:MAG: hypothetical protein KC684_09220 [Candidatus Omnitrophica bacterium]|nr:hypothetical protein [Candidatus Omnitrophota bacterium]